MSAHGRTPPDSFARLAFGIAALAVAVVVGFNMLIGRVSDEGSDSPAVLRSPAQAPGTDLGVFEPARGRVVVSVRGHLEAIDPFDGSSARVIEPGYLALGGEVAAGWSADGSKLALSTEYGELFVMDRTGSLDWVPVQFPDVEACPRHWPPDCAVAASAWLSPDGTKGLAFGSPPQGGHGPGRLHVMDLAGSRLSRVVEVERFERAIGDRMQPAMPVWSPDGGLAAYVWSKGGSIDTPAVGIVDLASGASRELISGWGLIRHLAWSPDGSQLLVVAGHDAPRAPTGDLNPLVQPQPASLYRVDIDDGEAHEVASGHFAVAAWSPDGAWIVAIDYPNEREVIVVGADGSGARTVATLDEPRGTSPVGGVAWHPVPAP
jgi:hypothetical protein